MLKASNLKVESEAPSEESSEEMEVREFPVNYLQIEESEDSITAEALLDSHRHILSRLNEDDVHFRQLSTGRILEYLLNGAKPKKAETTSNMDEKVDQDNYQNQDHGHAFLEQPTHVSRFRDFKSIELYPNSKTNKLNSRTSKLDVNPPSNGKLERKLTRKQKMMRQQGETASRVNNLPNYYIDIPVDAGGADPEEVKSEGILHRLNLAEQKQSEYCLEQLKG